MHVIALAVVLVLVPFASAAIAQETPRMGGVLKVATIGEPPTLDMPISTAVITYEIMWHVKNTSSCTRTPRSPSSSSKAPAS